MFIIGGAKTSLAKQLELLSKADVDHELPHWAYWRLQSLLPIFLRKLLFYAFKYMTMFTFII